MHLVASILLRLIGAVSGGEPMAMPVRLGF